ncbi:MAG TPA: lipocalin-like domain-containing protein [Bryobacteraceae bacterium]|nr:lipocalin-like domain-containing protein [Bryobacteraceae bacterium]
MTRRQAVATLAFQSHSQTQSSRRRFVGSWRLAQSQLIAGGRTVQHPYGKNAAGRLIYDADGYMSAQIMADEGAYGAFFGTYDIDEREAIVTHTIEGSSQPRQAGTRQRRRFRFSSDTLTLEGDGPEGHTVTTWQRLRRR